MRKTAAIVGRPNVGKSALFNRIVGKRISIVHDMPGVTRDRVSAEVEFRGKSFTLVDTGGIGLVRGQKSEDVILTVAMAQVDAAIEAAEVIIMVVNAQEGVVPMDVEVAKKLHASGKKVLLAANKVDNANHEKLVDEFAELGFNGIFGTSAIHGLGIDPLLKELCQGFPRNAESQAAEKPNPSEVEDPASQEPFKLAIVGRPNVGKSSLVNALTQSERVVVSEIPGTTRDAVDVPLKIEGEGEVLDLILIDTAGLRKKRRINDSIEFFSSKRTEDSIERCDLVVFVIDADHGIHEQDKKIADLITASHKACIIVVNKWDLVAEAVEKAKKEQNLKRKTMKPSDFAASREISSLNEFAEWVQKQLFFMSYAPVIFSSAKTGFHLDRLIEAVRFVKDQWRQAVPTGIFNRVLQDIIQSRPISSKSGKSMRIYYANQIRTGPPTFLLFTNISEDIEDNYRRYLESEIRRAFGFEGCPVILHNKARPKSVDSVRRTAKKSSRRNPRESSRSAGPNASSASRPKSNSAKSPPKSRGSVKKSHSPSTRRGRS